MTFKDAFNVVKYSAKIAQEAKTICSYLDLLKQQKEVQHVAI
jgi:hypothetical protein